MVDHSMSHEQSRQMKQNYLVENVVNEGYDTDAFGTWMNYYKGKQTANILTSRFVFQMMELMQIIGLWKKSSMLSQSLYSINNRCSTIKKGILNIKDKNHCIVSQTKMLEIKNNQKKESGLTLLANRNKKMRSGICPQ